MQKEDHSFYITSNLKQVHYDDLTHSCFILLYHASRNGVPNEDIRNLSHFEIIWNIFILRHSFLPFQTNTRLVNCLTHEHALFYTILSRFPVFLFSHFPVFLFFSFLLPSLPLSLSLLLFAC